MRVLVAVGDAPARWYRSLNEARYDARAVAAAAEVGGVVARAWVDVAEGPPAYELRRGARGALNWARRAVGAPGPSGRPAPG